MGKWLFLLIGAALIFAAANVTFAANCDLCGDTNGDGVINIADVISLIDYYYWPPIIPPCLNAADVNCDGAIRFNCYYPEYECDDMQYLMDYIFRGGPAPCDPDDDGLPNCDPY